MIRVRTVTDAHGTKRADVKMRGEIADIINETAIIIRNVNRMITSTIKDEDEQINARNVYAEILEHQYRNIENQCRKETEMHREAQEALKDDAEADLAERIWNSIQPEEK